MWHKKIMANVSLKGVYKYYANSDTPAVSDFNLDIADKEFIVFVGPSGCGKSTTLRMIAGLEGISEGEVYIDGRLVNEVEPKNRNIAMVFQNYALYPHMTVYKNMAFGLTMAKIPVEERDESTIILKSKDGKKLNPVALFFAKLFARTLKEERDELGRIVYDESGKPVYAVKKNKDGSAKVDKNGNPVYKKRRYTIDEYAGKPVVDENGAVKLIAKKDKDGNVKLNKNGEVVYKLRKYTKSEINEKVLEAARILDINQYLARKPKALSGGQRQRVAIGRSIVRHPKVFLFDEPLSNLDAKLRNQMRAEIIQLRKKINTTFVYVTHDQVEAMTLGDRIVIMKLGLVQQIGTPVEVFEHPVNLFVAGFIGTPQMNFFDAKLKKNGTNYVVELYGKTFALKASANEYLKNQNVAERDIVLGVRPEHINVLKKKTGKLAGADYLTANVKISEMMGSELYVHTSVSDDKDIVLRVPTVDLSEEERENIMANGDIQFTFTPEVMHIFDKETEENLIPIEVK